MDTFQYRDAADSAVADADQILDFEIGTDRIDLSFIDPDPGAGGDQSFAFVGAAAFTPGNLGEVRAEFDGGAGVWRIEGDTNGDATADFLILVTATTADPITAADFVL